MDDCAHFCGLLRKAELYIRMFDDNKMLIHLSAVVTNKEFSDQVPFVLHMNTSEVKLQNISFQ